MKKISLTQGKYALVDDKDFDFLNKWKWCALKDRNKNLFYAKRRNSQNKIISMHGLLLGLNGIGCKTKIVADHKDRNGLNNTRKNLRIVTRSENSLNRRKNSNNTSGFIGVHWREVSNKWVAQITINRKTNFLGYFVSKTKAAEAYKTALKIISLKGVLPLSPSQKAKIKGRSLKTSSGYVGVYWHQQTKKWVSKIYVNKKNKHLGLFTSKRKAARAYKNALKEIL